MTPKPNIMHPPENITFFEQLPVEQQEGLTPFEELSALEPAAQAEQINDLARDQVGDLVNGDELSGLIGNTNATGGAIDTMEVDPSSIEVSAENITSTADVQFAGDQDMDAGPAGTIISGTVTIRVLPDMTIEIGDTDFDLEEDDDSDYE